MRDLVFWSKFFSPFKLFINEEILFQNFPKRERRKFLETKFFGIFLLKKKKDK